MFVFGQHTGTRSRRAVRRLVEPEREEKTSFKGAQGAVPTLPAQPRVLLLYLGRSAATHVCDPLHFLSFVFEEQDYSSTQ